MPAELTEARIQRYGRQILLKELGGKGQRTLLERPVLLCGAGGALSVAAAYLAGGGSPVLAAPALEGFLHGTTLAAFNPDAGQAEGPPFLALGDRLPLPEAPAQVVARGGVAFAGPGACRACLAAAAGVLPLATEPADEVTVGSLAALTAQRLVLGWSEGLGLVTLTHGLPRAVEEAPRCERHR